MDRNDRAAILTSVSSERSSTALTQFCVTPYKICVSALVSVFFETRESAKLRESREMGREMGHFCVLIITLIQSLDCSYQHLLQQISPPFITNKVKKKMMDKLRDISCKGLSELMELMSSLKIIITSSIAQSHSEPPVHRTSIVGLFLRRMWLYFDKLSFSAVSQLFDDLVVYVNSDSDGNETVVSIRSQEKSVKSDTCPQQIQYFISKQLNLIEINEKQAMTPSQLLEAIDKNCDQTDIGISSPNNEYNDIHFLKYLNSLRVNEFAASKESLMAYFDGNSNQISRCWSALNLAILYAHFKHNELALQVLKECISTAQESNDEKCLEFALMWISRVLSQTDTNEGDHNICLLLNHLHLKANELNLPYISSLSQLHSEKLKSSSSDEKLHLSGSLSSSTPSILAVRHSMNDVLMMSYASRAALLNLYGASHLAALTSQVLLHLNVVEPIGDSNVYHVNENTCIGVRNIALHLWRIEGQYFMARDMLISLSQLYSHYKSNINAIYRQALAEIDFEHYLYCNNWKEAIKCIDIINSCDKTEANVRLAQLKAKQGDKYEAICIIEKTIKSDKAFEDNTKPYQKITTLLLKGKMLNDMPTILECIDLCKRYKLIGLECSCLVQLSLMLQQLDQISQSQQILNSIMIRLLANGTLSDICRAHHIDAVNHFRLFIAKANTDNEDNYLESALHSNERSIKGWKLLEDRESLIEGLTLQANIYNFKKDFSQRNYYALQARLEITSK